MRQSIDDKLDISHVVHALEIWPMFLYQLWDEVDV
jgi:hypothetical protein